MRASLYLKESPLGAAFHGKEHGSYLRILFSALLILAANGNLSSARADIADEVDALRAARYEKACAHNFRQLGISGPIVKTERLNASLKRGTGGRFPLLEWDGYDPDALYIGVARSRVDGSHHYYLVAGKRRFDGLPLYKASNVSPSRMASKGVVFKIPTDTSLVKAIEARLKSGRVPRGLTCLHALCKLLEQEGVKIGAVGEKVPVRSRVVAARLAEGKISVGNQPVDPATIRLLESDKFELVKFLEKAEDADEEVKAVIAQRAAGLIVGASFAGSMVYILIDRATRPAE